MARDARGSSPKKNPAAVALARLRAKSLTPQRRAEIAREAANARAKALSPSERREIARRAAMARWKKKAKRTE